MDLLFLCHVILSLSIFIIQSLSLVPVFTAALRPRLSSIVSPLITWFLPFLIFSTIYALLLCIYVGALGVIVHLLLRLVGNHARETYPEVTEGAKAPTNSPSKTANAWSAKVRCKVQQAFSLFRSAFSLFWLTEQQNQTLVPLSRAWDTIDKLKLCLSIPLIFFPLSLYPPLLFPRFYAIVLPILHSLLGFYLLLSIIGSILAINCIILKLFPSIGEAFKLLFEYVVDFSLFAKVYFAKRTHELFAKAEQALVSFFSKQSDTIDDLSTILALDLICLLCFRLCLSFPPFSLFFVPIFIYLSGYCLRLHIFGSILAIKFIILKLYPSLSEEYKLLFKEVELSFEEVVEEIQLSFDNVIDFFTSDEDSDSNDPESHPNSDSESEEHNLPKEPSTSDEHKSLNDNNMGMGETSLLDFKREPLVASEEQIRDTNENKMGDPDSSEEPMLSKEHNPPSTLSNDIFDIEEG
ncbi:hypothetical protein AMTR_s00010p00184010 [Amborella trichopoda]|uniref:Uncharacterized protein n=1 Tax=Amborella trichopoda TaxID=13333 RepID=W1NFD9_AMBTC|nr:hypothetical protein AMTR_s00010p00184010 [Amborella trichopoda]